MNKDLRLVVDLYKYHIIQITKNASYKFKMTPTRNQMILNFIELFKSMTNSDFVAEDNLRKFMEYQFNYWYKHDAKYGKGTSIQIEWIIGSKAIERWKSRTDKQKKKTDFIIRKNLKKDVKFSEVDKTASDDYKRILLKVRDSEENEKARFYNTSKGFSYCLISTSLYNHKSKYCSLCNKSSECKKYLEENFNKVYKVRGYHKN
jgi:hypothetical protein